MQSESQLRRRAQKNGLKLTKIREQSRDYPQYGPCMLVDPYVNCLVAWGMDLADVEAQLD